MPTSRRRPCLTPLPIPAHPTESEPARLRLWRSLRHFAALAPDRKTRDAVKQLGSSARVAKYVTAGMGKNSWARISSWLAKFRQFLDVVALDEGAARATPKLMRCNATALDFLAMVAEENKGRTRVAAASRAIEFVRRVLTIPPLSDDPRTKLLKEGVLRYSPHKPKGALPFPVIAVLAIAHAWGRHKNWWRRSAALAIYLAFVALLRGAGLLGVPREGVTWLTDNGEATNPTAIPRKHKGVLLLLPTRKTKQKTWSFTTVRAGMVTRLLATHLRWLRSRRSPPRFLFPARRPGFSRRVGKRSWRYNPNRPMSSASLLRLMREALVQVCGLSPAQARRFTVHSLRVGGVNYYRSLGVSTELRAQLADHLSLRSNLRYLRMNPTDQIKILDSIVKGHDGL